MSRSWYSCHSIYPSNHHIIVLPHLWEIIIRNIFLLYITDWYQTTFIAISTQEVCAAIDIHKRYFEHLKAVELDGSNKASSARRPHFVSKLSKCWGSFQATFLLHYQHICRFMNPNDNLFPNITKWFCWLDPLRVPRVDGKLFWKGCKHVISKRGHPSRVFLW